MNHNLFWVPLDNAAKIYPAIRTREQTTVFRLTAVLNERVAVKYLMDTLSLANERFPYYKVSLRKGIFWYYLEESAQPLILRADKELPCRAFSKNNRYELLVRVLVFNNTISVEFSHILTDGNGASRFLKWILQKYFELKRNCNIAVKQEIISPNLIFEEFEDSYAKYFKENIPVTSRQPKAYHLPFPLKPKPRFEVLVATLEINAIKNIATEKGVSVTEYLVAVYLYTLQKIINEDKREKFKKNILRIQVPINLRKIYQSETMRNFSLFIMPEIDTRLGNYTFDEILKIVFHKMKLETDEKLISKIISRNVGSEKKLLIRGIPLFLKSIVLRYKYYSEGANQFTGVITNLGKIDLPEEIRDSVDYFIFTPPPPDKRLKVNCGVIGYKNRLTLSFGNITLSKEMERKFIRFLTNQGIHVKINKL